jgi:hypothetical protein
MGRMRLFSVGLAAAVVLAGVVASSAAADRTSLTGGGTVDVTDADGNVFPDAGEFALSAGVRPDGSPYGRITFVFKGDFASYWGAVPGVTHAFRLTGEVADVQTIGSSIVVSGTLTEVDTAKGDGVVFVEESVPFEIVSEVGSDSFVFQFCLLPPFYVDVATGRLTVQLSGQSAGN